MTLDPSFDANFLRATGFQPMGWQRRLFTRFVENDLPQACDIPTGLGKTSVITIWALALAAQASAKHVTLPRRLVYVVNRRTVVDQATDDAMKLRAALADPALAFVRDALASLCVDRDDEASPVAVSTLRGELADNREWQADPGRPAVIVGTVDMVGSRLLFSGYGRVGWKMRAFHAGLVGQDALLVHDEAHLTPAFGALVREVARVQLDASEPRPLRVLELSATQRDASSNVFTLTKEEYDEEIVRRRVRAKKALAITSVDDQADVPKEIVKALLVHREARARIMAYVRSPETAKEVVENLRKELRGKRDRVALLTGTLRGYERDALSSGALFSQFKANENRPAIEESLFLVSTSAGEVGANLDADHLACDLSTLDSMVQRFGRVNRLGRDDETFVAKLDIVDAPPPKTKGKAEDGGDESKYEAARSATRTALSQLPGREGGRNASPGALRVLLDPATVDAAFAPPPRVVPCTDVLLDAWALTSIREPLPGRPAVAPWLHGVQSDPPETVIAWREETTALTHLLRKESGDTGSDSNARRERRAKRADNSSVSLVEEWFEQHRIEPRERLRDSADRVLRELRVIAERLGEKSVEALLVSDAGVEAKAIAAIEREDIADTTVILPLEAGGLDAEGLLSGRSSGATDVADLAAAWASRFRILASWSVDADAWAVRVLGRAAPDLSADLVLAAANEPRRIDRLSAALLAVLNRQETQRNPMLAKAQLILAEEEGEPSEVLLAFALSRRPETVLDTSSTAPENQTLRDHLAWTGAAAERLGHRLGLPDGIASAVTLAARWHDRGKDRRAWQRAIFHAPPRSADLAWEPWAKTRHGRFDYAACPGYRHELGSAIEATSDPDLAAHSEHDLLLHLIASHHGRARPHFTAEAWDPEATDDVNAAVVRASVIRYARLQRRFGRWGLAWLEAILKCADVIATIEGPGMEALAQ
jgi:CRISPR-associated endonuclease/helicase Cas3